MAWPQSLLILRIYILGFACSKCYRDNQKTIQFKDMSSVIWILEVRKQQGRVICSMPCHESFCGLPHL